MGIYRAKIPKSNSGGFDEIMGDECGLVFCQKCQDQQGGGMGQNRRN